MATMQRRSLPARRVERRLAEARRLESWARTEPYRVARRVEAQRRQRMFSRRGRGMRSRPARGDDREAARPSAAAHLAATAKRENTPSPCGKSRMRK
jgi:hypothetical protein